MAEDAQKKMPVEVFTVHTIKCV